MGKVYGQIKVNLINKTKFRDKETRLQHTDLKERK